MSKIPELTQLPTVFNLIDKLSDEMDYDNAVDFVKRAVEEVLSAIGIEQDVAYMPVPRCDQCRHLQYQNLGRGLFNLRCGKRETPFPVTLDFGCVLWEKK